MEHLDAAFYERVRVGYLELVEREPERMKVIAADATPEEVAGDVWAALCEHFDFLQESK